MKTRLVLRPGQRGTRQLCTLYGDRLLFVRYRYDTERQLRIKTAEIVIDEAPWNPKQKHETDEYVEIVTGPKELALHERIREAGGTWNGLRGAWRIKYAQAVSLGLEGRITSEE